MHSAPRPGRASSAVWACCIWVLLDAVCPAPAVLCLCSIRYVGPGRQQVVALQDLGQAEPLEGEDMAHLKNRLAAGAAEAMELQLR